MNKKAESLILDQNWALSFNGQRPEVSLKELWDAGLESGVAGDVDEVFDRVLRTLNSAGHVM